MSQGGKTDAVNRVVKEESLPISWAKGLGGNLVWNYPNTGTFTISYALNYTTNKVQLSVYRTDLPAGSANTMNIYYVVFGVA